MSFKFPFSTYHELNLDWILKKVETLSVNAEADANTIATYEERLQTAETQAQNAETSAANAQTAATSAASVAQNALTTANSAQSSADASGALASQAATKADAAQSAAESARQAAETAQATAANFDGRITSAEQQASEALNMAQSFDEQARAAITTANNAANVATEAQAMANSTALELARQRTQLETIGSQQTAAINSAGTAQVTAINSAGQAVLDSLPADYMNGVELVKDYTLGLYPQIETDYASILNFDNGADNIPVKELMVNIIPYQSGIGTPSPTNIRPISGWTGAEISINGVNMWDEQWEIGGLENATGNPFSATDRIRSKNFSHCLALTNYYCVSPSLYLSIFWYTSDKVFISWESAGNRIVTAPATASFFKIVLANNVTTYRYNISINYPSSDISYHAYNGSKITVSFPDGAGTIYRGKLTLNPDRTGTLVMDNLLHAITGDETFLQTSNINSFLIGSNQNSFMYQAVDFEGGNVVPIVSHYNGVTYRPSADLLNGESMCFNGANGKTILFKDTRFSSVAEFTTYATEQNNAGTPITFVIPLANPVTYPLTSEQISGILSTLYGFNNVWADAGNTSLTYRADLGLYITENSIANYTKFAGMIAGVETGLTASKTYSTGDYFILGQKLYKALTTIATGATFTLGTNCEETTVGAELILAQ